MTCERLGWRSGLASRLPTAEARRPTPTGLLHGRQIMTIQLGYCTNVHAGVDLEQTQANLERFARVVKRRFSPQAPMGVGLWLSASAARGLLDGQRLPPFAAWLAEVGLVPFTLNGFPYGDFHRRVVK